MQWSAQFELPEEYIEQHTDLAYAGNVHVAEGRTVDTAHLVVDDTIGRESFYVGMSRGRERNTAYMVTERARAADPSPKSRPAPDLADPGAHDDSALPPHRLTVLAGVLEREQAERTATETMRQELERAASLATLTPIWADVTRTHAVRQYERTLRSLLGPAEWQQYEQDPERGTLTRLLRAAELAGHDVDEALRRASQARNFDGARSIAAVLHGRVQRIVGTPEPIASTGYAGRTPALEDPVADQFAHDLATAMDERVSVLGIRVALDRPAWAVGYLGDVPADLVEQAAWIQRARVIAAYREERGYAHETDPIGPAPERASPEQRASWHAAYVALRMPEARHELAAATDGELWSRRAAYARETAWAPPYVADELRNAHIAEDAYRADAVRAWHRADAATGDAERVTAQQEAGEYGALAQQVGSYREVLTEVAQARRRWHTATELNRQKALAADGELRRRHPDMELPPLHPPGGTSPPGPDAEQAPRPSTANRTEVDHEMDANQPDAAPLDVKAALAAARMAEKILAEREHQANQDADLADDLMPRREAEAAEEASARRSAVRQEPAPSQRAMALEREELELEAGH
jgi:hypothetical protein